jgi:HK97 family phage portal protein
VKVKLPIIGQVWTNEPQSAPVTATKKTSASKEKLTVGQLGAGFLDLSMSSNSLVNDKTISEKLLRSFVGWVYANVSVLAEEISKMEFELYQIKLVKGEIELVELDSHPLLDLLDRFNPFTTTSEAMYMTEAHLELAGDTFYLLDSATSPKNIFILQPDMVTVNPGAATEAYNIQSYDYKIRENGKSKIVTYPADRVIHIKNPNPSNPYRGKSVVEAAATTIDIDTLSEQFLKKFFENGAVPNFALSSDQRISKEDIDRMTLDLKKTYGGIRGAFKTLILGGGLKPVTVQQSGKEMQLLEIENNMRDKLMALFKNTKASLGIVEDVNRANAEATLLGWKQSVIKPKMQRIVDTLNEFLVPRFGDNLLLTFTDPVPQNEAEDIDQVVALMGTNVRQTITVNEARAIIGQDPLPGDEFDQIQTAPQNTFVAPPVDPNAKRWKAAMERVDYKSHFRRLGVYQQQRQFRDIYEVAREMAKKIVQARHRKAVTKTEKAEAERQRYRSVSNEQALEYWSKQIQITEVMEKRFKDRIDRFILAIEEKAVSNLHSSVPKNYKKTKTEIKAFDLFDPEVEIQAGIDLFTPLVEEMAVLAANEAYQLMKINAIYHPSARLKERVATAVKEFTESFVGTDRDQLTKILTDALESGQSVAEIERAIREEFGHYRREQSLKIARTETLRASNEGALDAFKQSGVVEAKQWLTAEDDRVDEECAELDGQIVSLGKDFFETNYGSGEQPPLHPNCRCVLLPVLLGAGE